MQTTVNTWPSLFEEAAAPVEALISPAAVATPRNVAVSRFWANPVELSAVWQAVALDFEGEEHTEYFEAPDEATATEKAADVFGAMGVSIYQLFIYQF